MARGKLFQNVKYYGTYQLLYVVLVVVLTSVGAFFHFLLDHEIGIVEAWLHNNNWEILILSKLLSLYLINRWFKVRLYQLKPVRELLAENVRWPEPRALVCAAFMAVSYLYLGAVVFSAQNVGYWYHHVASFLGLFLYFGTEFVLIAYLDDVLNQKGQPPQLWLTVCYTGLFAAAFRVSVPDYYRLLPYVIFCFSTLMYMSGKSFKSWSNVLCFLLVFVAPMGAVFGLDPVWGDDFSPFRIRKPLNLAFLCTIWVISFLYYKYRDQVLQSIRKLSR